MNEVCTSLLVFEGEGRVVEYFGGYDDWQKEKAAQAAAAVLADEKAKREAKEAAEAAAGPAKKVRKLSNKERAELTRCRR